MRVTMLILTLKENKIIFIGENVSIILVQIRGKEVKVGIEAAPNMRVLRDKVLKRIRLIEPSEPQGVRCLLLAIISNFPKI